MDQEPLRRLLHSLRRSAEPAGAAAGDALLLQRFVAASDHTAFELLVWRHGPMVLGVCRRLLPTAQDAEDAFQATFLTLVKRAGSIANGAALGAWLYRVAYRVALRARATLAARARRERPGVEDLPEAFRGDPVVAGDLRDVLDEEVNRLPARHRAAFVLCCLEGKTGAEAARELGCPPGTVSSRVTRARERLRRRLARRGLAPAVVGAVGGDALAAAVPPALAAGTVEAAVSFAAGGAVGGALSSQAVTLAEGVLRAMSMTRLKIAAVLTLVLGILAGVALTRPALDAALAGEARQDVPPVRPPQQKPKEVRKPGPAVVRVATPLPGGLERTTLQECSVQAFDQEDIYPAVAGVLKGQAVDIGAHVKKGQVLAEIDAPLLVLDEKQAAAGVKQVKGQLREGEARIAALKSEVQTARAVILQRQADLASAKANLAFQGRQYQRFKALSEANSIDVRLLDEKEAQRNAAQAQVGAAEAAVGAARAELEVKQSRVAQAEAALEPLQAGLETAEIALEKARYVLGLTKITSPVDGVVTRRSYQNGHYLRTAEQAGGLPLLTVQRTDRVRVVVHVAEQDVPLTEPGVPVDVRISALPGVRLTGYKVSRIGFALDKTTATMRAEIDVPNPRQQLRPGMYGSATLHLKTQPDRLRIPASALIDLGQERKGGPGRVAVYVVRDGKAHLTPIQQGIREDPDVEIVAGLRPSDLVVIHPKGLKGAAVPVEIEKGPAPR